MTSDLQSLITPETRIKVSSTLDKSVGKKYLTDGNPDTCWTSQQGLPQTIQLSFSTPVVVQRLSFTFQGGFVGTRCLVEGLPTAKDEGRSTWRSLTRVYPEDVNRQQVFDLAPSTAGAEIESIKVIFEDSSDFFGRITIYDLKVEGLLVPVST
ncbi:hypothetical protein JAAARDRAFT_147028 [Jaapia argillacea MUCL 33604]|uniref:F5/8 type C domain-containing protein n=1 Tax=Jaapia argillacea MUCL 33604 TaxID=933084 RepID=A0A067QA83_9AGAM|nr:hypothetical protein JAAARDRAFT_147028 [Jaapia argillacea MUCL 33604]